MLSKNGPNLSWTTCLISGTIVMSVPLLLVILFALNNLRWGTDFPYSLFAFFSKTDFIQFFAFLVFVMTTHMLRYLKGGISKKPAWVTYRGEGAPRFGSAGLSFSNNEILQSVNEVSGSYTDRRPFPSIKITLF